MAGETDLYTTKVTVILCTVLEIRSNTGIHMKETCKGIKECVKTVKRFKKFSRRQCLNWATHNSEVFYFHLQLPGSPLYHLCFITQPLGHSVPFEF